MRPGPCPPCLQGAVASALRNAGQTCICANRVFVQDTVHDKFAGVWVG